MDDRYHELERDVSEKTEKLRQAWEERNSKDEEKRRRWRVALDELHEAGRRFAEYLEESEKGAS